MPVAVAEYGGAGIACTGAQSRRVAVGARIEQAQLQRVRLSGRDQRRRAHGSTGPTVAAHGDGQQLPALGKVEQEIAQVDKQGRGRPGMGDIKTSDLGQGLRLSEAFQLWKGITAEASAILGEGRGGVVLQGASLSGLVRAKDASLDGRLGKQLGAVRAAIEAIPPPFDHAVLSAPKSPGNDAVQAAVTVFQPVQGMLDEAARVLGIVNNL